MKAYISYISEMRPILSQWVEEFYLKDGNVNRRIELKFLYDSFFDYADRVCEHAFMSVVVFKRWLQEIAKEHGLIYNPHLLNPETMRPLRYSRTDGRYDMEDHEDGCSYITLGNEDFWNLQQKGGES